MCKLTGTITRPSSIQPREEFEKEKPKLLLGRKKGKTIIKENGYCRPQQLEKDSFQYSRGLQLPLLTRLPILHGAHSPVCNTILIQRTVEMGRKTAADARFVEFGIYVVGWGTEIVLGRLDVEVIDRQTSFSFFFPLPIGNCPPPTHDQQLYATVQLAVVFFSFVMLLLASFPKFPFYSFVVIIYLCSSNVSTTRDLLTLRRTFPTIEND